MLHFKIILRRLISWLEKNLIGSYLQNLTWKYRHIYTKHWAEGYLETVYHHHRQQLIDQLNMFKGFSSLVELGSGPGANLVKIALSYPDIYLQGVDINKSAIVVGNNFAAKNHLKINFTEANINSLSIFEDSSFDVVLTDATLMFITPLEINNVIKQMIRISKRGLILNEFSLTGELQGFSDGGRWIYDLEKLIKNHSNNAVIYSSKSDFNDDRKWQEYGKLIRVHFE